MTKRMDVEQSVALEASISTWERRCDGEEIHEGRDNCALCKLAESKNNGLETCRGCIIAEHTGSNMCLGTPYSEISRHDSDRKFRELKFLKSLRQYNPLQAGDIVNCTDGSYHIRLTDTGCGSLGNICWQKGGERYRYVVMFTGLTLPASGSMTGKKENDTIIRDLDTDEYIFTMERFLERAEEEKEICSECGTEL